MAISSLRVAYYFFLFLDDYLHFTKNFFLKKKSKGFVLFQKYHFQVTIQFGQLLLILQIDNGGKFISKVFSTYYELHSFDYYETFSSIIKMISLCLLLTLSIYYDFYIHQMDVIIIFLNGVLKEEIYITQLEGFVVPSHKYKIYSYVSSILNYFSMKNCHAISTLFKANVHFSQGLDFMGENIEFMASIPYAHIIRSLQYLITCTRYYLPFAIHHMAQFIAKPNYARDLDTQKSTSGYLLYVKSSLLSWHSEKQVVIAQSITLPSIICCNNQSYIVMTQNPRFYDCTKYIDIKYHYIRDKVKANEVIFEFIPINKMKANIMTKSLLKSNQLINQVVNVHDS
uniref:Reverse transcriptase Ty1/copia-type domain-containing protein n=1 Tax=Physcomitrium patens TaxID=3218 RepID=A0A2K1JIS6_PHYPA|nr:hypothetical protein PHYPA_018855 [Physcomitrium patens]